MDAENETVALLKALRTEVISKIDASIAAIEPPPTPIPWTPREYVSGKFMVEQRMTDTVPPGMMANVCFHGQYIEREAMIAGLPETAVKRDGIEHDFIFESLSINDEDAPHFDVRCILGARLFWAADVAVPASRFAASAPVVRFDQKVHAHLIITVQAINKSDKPQPFRAKIIGKEQIKP
jgi:hypothetical protein